MDFFETARIAYESLQRVPQEEKQEIVPLIMAQFEAIIEMEQTQAIFSNNETLEDLNEETIPYALASYYLGLLISNHILQKEKRLQAVNLALNNFQHFVDILMLYKMITNNEIKLMGKQLDPGSERDVKREMMLVESKLNQEAQQAINELNNKTEKMSMDQIYLILIKHAKYRVFREIRYLEEEKELIEFEQNCPDEARLAAEQHRLLNQSGSGKKPKLVSLTEKDVDRIVKHNKFVPLDTVELLRLEEQKKQIQIKQTADDVQQSLEINQKIDFHKVDLEYGGGNPYSYALPGEHHDFRDYRYEVVRTDTFQPGQVKEQEIDLQQQFYGENDLDRQQKYTVKPNPDGPHPDAVEEDYDQAPEKRAWDDWKDDNPAGYGNKPRLV